MRKTEKLNLKEKLLIIIIFILLVAGAVFLTYDSSGDFRDLTGYAIYIFTGPDQANLTIDFDDEVGVVREDFYGVSNFNGYLSNLSYISSSGEWGKLNKRSDSTFTRNAFEDANLKVFRSWAFLTLLSTGEGTWNTLDTDESYHATLHNINALTDQNKWAYENDKIMMYNIASMPEWLADTTSGWCSENPIDGLDYSDDFINTNYSSCSPNNYTKYQDTLVSLALNISNNCEYADNIWFNIGNEMEANNWLNNLPDDDPIKAREFVKLYNHSYDALNSICDGRFKLGGNSGLRFYPEMREAYLSNMSSKMDYYSENIYSDNYEPYIETNTIDNRIENIVLECSSYNANCSHIIISEWGYIFDSNKGEDYMKLDLSYVYLSMLNKYPEKISLMFHEFMMPVNSSDYKFISEPTLENSFYHPYNVTRNFATYHSAGNMVVKSNSNLDTINILASKNSNGDKYITIINSGLNTYLNLTTDDNQSVEIQDLGTGENHDIINNSIDLGTINRYEVKHFLIIYENLETEDEVITPTQESSSSSSSSGSSGSSSIEDSIDTSENIYNDSIENDSIKNSGDNEIKLNPSKTKEEQRSDLDGNILTGQAVSGKNSTPIWINIIILFLIIMIIVISIIIFIKIKNIAY